MKYQYIYIFNIIIFLIFINFIIISLDKANLVRHFNRFRDNNYLFVFILLNYINDANYT